MLQDTVSEVNHESNLIVKSPEIRNDGADVHTLAPYVLSFAKTNRINAAIISHPSRLQIPKDFEDLLATSNAPLLINSCEVDPAFPIDDQKKADEYLGDGKYKPGYKRTYWPGCTHGFGVRESYLLDSAFQIRIILLAIGSR